MSAGVSARFVVNTQCAVSRAGRYLMIVRGEGVRQAPGVLAFPGGKVEVGDGPDSVLEAAVRREVGEETGVTVAPELTYVRSVSFTMADGAPVVDVLFLGAYKTGEPAIAAPDEVADIRWMTAEEIVAHERTPPWLKSDIELVEAARLARVEHAPSWHRNSTRSSVATDCRQGAGHRRLDDGRSIENVRGGL